jgi:type IV pilus assembly protein PilA
MHRRAAHPPRTRAALSILALAAGCGGAPARPPDAPAPAAPASRRPLDTVAPGATLVVRVDGKALRAAPAFAGILGAVRAGHGPLGAAGQRLLAWDQACGFAIADVVDEVVGSGDLDDKKGPLVAVRLSIPTDRALGCLERIGEGGHATAIAGARGVRWDADCSADPLAAAATPEMLLVGSESVVKDALARLASPGLIGAPGLAEKLEKPASGVASAYAVFPEQERARSVAAAIEADATHIWIHAALGTPSTETALRMSREGQAMVGQLAGAVPEGPEGQMMRAVLAAVHVNAVGSRVEVGFGVQGGAPQQAAFLGAVSAMGIFGVRRYLASAKTAEAKHTVGELGRRLARYAEDHRKAPRFPASTGRVPAEVPRGKAYVAGAGDWGGATWKALGFSMEGKQYYSYEIATSADGRTATVSAYGDLNGDGVTSRFQLKVVVGKDGSVSVSPQMVVEKEFE